MWRKSQLDHFLFGGCSIKMGDVCWTSVQLWKVCSARISGFLRWPLEQQSCSWHLPGPLTYRVMVTIIQNSDLAFRTHSLESLTWHWNGRERRTWVSWAEQIGFYFHKREIFLQKTRNITFCRWRYWLQSKMWLWETFWAMNMSKVDYIG